MHPVTTAVLLFYKGGDVRLYLLGTQAVLKSFAGHTWQVLPWQSHIGKK